MTDMITFSDHMLSSLASFLGSEPIIYLFGLILALCVVKIVMTFFKPFTKK